MGKQVKTTARKGKERQKKEVKENKYKEEQGEMKTKKYRTVIIVLAWPEEEKKYTEMTGNKHLENKQEKKKWQIIERKMIKDKEKYVNT